jgi:hypothetical protein
MVSQQYSQSPSLHRSATVSLPSLLRIDVELLNHSHDIGLLFLTVTIFSSRLFSEFLMLYLFALAHGFSGPKLPAAGPMEGDRKSSHHHLERSERHRKKGNRRVVEEIMLPTETTSGGQDGPLQPI